MTSPAVKKLMTAAAEARDFLRSLRGSPETLITPGLIAQRIVNAFIEVEAEEAAPVHPVENWMDVAKRTGTKFVTEADVEALTTDAPPEDRRDREAVARTAARIELFGGSWTCHDELLVEFGSLEGRFALFLHSDGTASVVICGMDGGKTFTMSVDPLDIVKPMLAALKAGRA